VYVHLLFASIKNICACDTDYPVALTYHPSFFSVASKF
jgi:hypothetical protein